MWLVIYWALLTCYVFWPCVDILVDPFVTCNTYTTESSFNSSVDVAVTENTKDYIPSSSEIGRVVSIHVSVEKYPSMGHFKQLCCLFPQPTDVRDRPVFSLSMAPIKTVCFLSAG